MNRRELFSLLAAFVLVPKKDITIGWGTTCRVGIKDTSPCEVLHIHDPNGRLGLNCTNPDWIFHVGQK